VCERGGGGSGSRWASEEEAVQHVHKDAAKYMRWMVEEVSVGNKRGKLVAEE
jgi:hypothetical protein